MYRDQAFVYIVPKLKDLPTETGKDKVQRDICDFVGMMGQVIGEQGYLCPRRSLRCCQPGCTINILQKKADLLLGGNKKREKCIEMQHLSY